MKDILHGPTVKKHLSRGYVGLIGFDERWKTAYSVLGFQIRFSGHPNFRFFGFGRPSSPNQMCYQLDMSQKFRNLITFPKLSQSLRYSNGNPKNFAWSPQKTWKMAFWRTRQKQSIPHKRKNEKNEFLTFWQKLPNCGLYWGIYLYYYRSKYSSIMLFSCLHFVFWKS